jgi:tRNA (cmo5U34)-methyltransferase
MRQLAASGERGRVLPIDLSAAVTPPCLRLGDPGNHLLPADAIRRGGESRAAGRIGAILVAGGQGTRLGCRGPKGLHPIGLARLTALVNAAGFSDPALIFKALDVEGFLLQRRS